MTLRPCWQTLLAAWYLSRMTEDERYLKAVGQQLRAEIAASGRSAAAVARMADMDRTVLHRYLHGTRDIPSTALKRICAAIGIAPAIVLDRAEQRMDTDAGMTGGKD